MIKQSIKNYCRWCSGDQTKEVSLCPVSTCALHPFRNGGKPQNLKRLKAISLRCLDCRETKQEARQCSDATCPLFYYRTGKNPARKGLGNKDIKMHSKFKKAQFGNAK